MDTPPQQSNSTFGSRSEHESLLREFLNKLRLMSAGDSDSVHVCVWGTLKLTSMGGEPQNIGIERVLWLKLVSETQRLAGSTVSERLLNLVIGPVLGDIDEYPLSATAIDFLVSNFYVRLTKRLTALVPLEALVPIHQLKFDSGTEIQLAHSILCPAASDSLLVQKYSSMGEHFDQFNSATTPFLKIRVQGESDQRNDQINAKTEASLMVLRFVTPWGADRGSRKNPAASVSMWRHDIKSVVFHQPELISPFKGKTSELHPFHQISEREIFYAKSILYLDHINHHFQTDDNEVSRRVLRALEMYDSGAIAKNTWQALYRFVAASEIVNPVPDSKRDKIAEVLNALIQYAGVYPSVTVEYLPDGIDPTDWNAYVERRVEPFSSHYKDRSKIIHGEDAGFQDPRDESVESARQIAQAGILALAKLSRVHNWTTNEQVKGWLRSKRTDS